MKFKKNADRMHHPEASRIPQTLWDDLFSSSFPDEFIPLMRCPERELIASLPNTSSWSSQKKMSAWLCMALSHPHLTVEQLDQMAKKLNIPDVLMLQLGAQWGNGPYFKHLINQDLQHDLAKRVGINDYAVFRLAARHGHLNILIGLDEACPTESNTALSLNDYATFREAAINGHLDLIKHFEKKAPDQLQDMIASHDYGAFRGAASADHMHVLDYLEEKAPDQLQKMINAQEYEGFRWAAGSGYFDVLRYFEKKSPDHIKAMIVAKNYAAYQWAAANGHLSILKHLEEQAPDLLQEMMTALNHAAFRMAVRYEHQDVIHHLMSNAAVFDFADTQMQYGSRYTTPFVDEKIMTLREQKARWEQVTSHEPFDVADASEARFWFYLLRHLIRRQHEPLSEDIALLLSIPSVKNLVHTDVNPGHPNELLRLAIHMGHQSTAQLLLDIPAVRDLAEQNDDYHFENKHGLDLRRLAQNHESSMTAPSPTEQHQLQSVMDRYLPKVKALGVDSILADLRSTLETRFHDHPPTIHLNVPEEEQQTLVLPLTWEAFQALKLKGERYQQALIAYYQDKNHTAWRNLAQKNPWLNPHAKYMHIDPEHPLKQRATFEGYEELISVLYLAVQDKEAKPTDGFDLPTRLDYFIAELAYIGRAHNWDKKRIKPTKDGPCLLVEHLEPILEEYDDLKADRPSCYSGIYHRLILSIKGHDLFSLFTLDQLKQEMHDFVRQHVECSIQDSNRTRIKSAWDKVVMGEPVSEEDWAALKQLDISPEKQQAFMALLRKKYTPQFDDLRYPRIIQGAFAFKQNPDAHILNFGHIHPEQFLFREPSRNTEALVQVGFFSRPTSSTDHNTPCQEQVLAK